MTQVLYHDVVDGSPASTRSINQMTAGTATLIWSQTYRHGPGPNKSRTINGGEFLANDGQSWLIMFSIDEQRPLDWLWLLWFGTDVVMMMVFIILDLIVVIILDILICYQKNIPPWIWYTFHYRFWECLIVIYVIAFTITIAVFLITIEISFVCLDLFGTVIDIVSIKIDLQMIVNQCNTHHFSYMFCMYIDRNFT